MAFDCHWQNSEVQLIVMNRESLRECVLGELAIESVRPTGVTTTDFILNGNCINKV